MFPNYNSGLIEFLNESFLHSNNVTFEEMVALFANDFGVDVSRSGDLFLFKYDMISVKWNAVTRQCRGSILTNDGEDSSWRYVARLPDKFFNLREGHCKYFDEKLFLSNMYKLKLRSKEDGSGISCYFHDGKWKASTL